MIKRVVYNLCGFRMSTKKKCDLVKIILKILTQRKKLSTNLQDTRGVQYTRLIKQKTGAIFTGDQNNRAWNGNN